DDRIEAPAIDEQRIDLPRPRRTEAGATNGDWHPRLRRDLGGQPQVGLVGRRGHGPARPFRIDASAQCGAQATREPGGVGRGRGRGHQAGIIIGCSIVAGPAMTYPSLARRTRRIAPFRVMELVGRAAARQAAGRPVIHLSIGEPDFTAPPPVIEALESAARAGRARYTPANGTPALRSAISHWYAERFGIDVAPARILVTAGASGALTLACAALVDPGDR